MSSSRRWRAASQLLEGSTHAPAGSCQTSTPVVRAIAKNTKLSDQRAKAKANAPSASAARTFYCSFSSATVSKAPKSGPSSTQSKRAPSPSYGSEPCLNAASSSVPSEQPSSSSKSETVSTSSAPPLAAARAYASSFSAPLRALASVDGKRSDKASQAASGSTSLKTAVRVTDRRSDPEGRQAEMAARDKERRPPPIESTPVSEAIRATMSASQSPPTDAGMGTARADSHREPASQSISSSFQQGSQHIQAPTSGSLAAPLVNPATMSSSSELLKQRLQQAQERLERPLPSTGLGIGWPATVNVDSEGTVIQHGPSVGGHAAGSPSSGTTSTGALQREATASSTDGTSSYSQAPESGSEGFDMISSDAPVSNTAGDRRFEPNLLRDHLFDTRAFVRRLEESGFLNKERLADDAQGGKRNSRERTEEVMRSIAAAQQGSAPRSKGKDKAEEGQQDSSEGSGSQAMELSTQPEHRPHDPAQAIMELTASFLKGQGSQALSHLLDRPAVENQRYLFTAALSELRTELQVRARNDAAALRSITTLLQREVDGLSQKMKEDIEQMKHDIQVDMNNRKGEAKEEQNLLDQEIQDLNNRFTISLSDLKTEIEQSIKWDLTRRALALVFGIAAITVMSLFVADFLSKRKERQLPEGAAASTSAQAGSETSAQASSVNGTSGPGGSGDGLFKRRGKPATGSGSSIVAQAGAGGAIGVSGGSVRPEELGLVEQYDMDQEARVV